MTQKFSVSPAQLEVAIGNAMPNELLHILTQRGQAFLEKIPSERYFYTNRKEK
jgi:ABC-2 type transport system ATP-binding protein